jgi:hypothetical protein
MPEELSTYIKLVLKKLPPTVTSVSFKIPLDSHGMVVTSSESTIAFTINISEKAD